MKKATYFYGIWCQNGIPFLAPYSAKTEPVLAPYGVKNGITFLAPQEISLGLFDFFKHKHTLEIPVRSPENVQKKI